MWVGGAPTLNWVLLPLSPIVSPIVFFAQNYLLASSLPIKTLSLSPFLFATDDEMEIHFENSGKKHSFCIYSTVSP